MFPCSDITEILPTANIQGDHNATPKPKRACADQTLENISHTVAEEHKDEEVEFCETVTDPARSRRFQVEQHLRQQREHAEAEAKVRIPFLNIHKAWLLRVKLTTLHVVSSDWKTILLSISIFSFRT